VVVTTRRPSRRRRVRPAAIACRTEATAETARRDFSGVPIHLGRILSIGHELRLSAQWGRIKAMIDEGEIGDALTLRARVEDRRTMAEPG
jgi:predicted dehydrogenase